MGLEPITDASFQCLKAWICVIFFETTLAYYHRVMPVIIQIHTSQYRLAAAILHDRWPMAFANKTLTDIESPYTNIERECLSVSYSLEKFNTYIYGRHIMDQNDLKPWEMIQHKPIHTAPPCLQCMFICLQKYDFNMQYTLGKEMVLAYRLSRLPSHKENFPQNYTKA